MKLVGLVRFRVEKWGGKRDEAKQRGRRRGWWEGVGVVMTIRRRRRPGRCGWPFRVAMAALEPMIPVTTEVRVRKS